MRRRVVFFSLTVFLVTFLITLPAFSQPTPPQAVGEATSQEIEGKRKLEKKISQPRPKPEEATAEEVISKDTGEKVLIKQIIVEGATLVSQAEISKITADFEGKELSLKSMQKVADLITDEYRKKGYATSRAYVPPQKIKDGVLTIRVVEGKLGSLEIRGNKYFRTSLLEKEIEVKPAGYFDYSALQRSLVYINEHPDRKARATLVPGKEPGTTDLVIDVTDRLPFHAGFEYDNYGSRYIEKQRYAMVLEHNNLLGFNDKAYFKLQYSDSSRLQLQQGRYNFPINPKLNIGAYALVSKLKLTREFALVDARGKAQMYGLFLNGVLLNKEDIDLRWNFGFDYKSIKNYLQDIQDSRDEVRVFKGGIDLDNNDAWGRNILTYELDLGVPDFMGGMDDKDPEASRLNAGGQFVKVVLNYYRLQPLPFATSLLWKNSTQFTNYNLVACEQFQIGGPVSVRGYPPAEASGDSGYYTSPELSIPLYFISKEMKVPYSKDVYMYDASRLVLFYDWATASFHSLPGEKKRSTLKGCGFGFRFNVKDNLSFRVELGYPQGKTPSDGHHAHPWIELVLKY